MLQTTRVLFFSILLLHSAVKAQETFQLGIVPQQSAKVLARKWTPFAQYLSQETGIQFKFATAKDIPTFESRLTEKKYQLAYMNPYHFVHFNERSGYEALAKQMDKRIRGIIVARKDTSLQSLHELHGLTLAFPAPAAFAASILTRGILEQQDIEFTPKYVSSHDSVYYGVAKGIFPAGGGVMRTFQLAPADVREQLMIFHKTEGFTPHALAVSDEVPIDMRKKILNAILTLSQTTQGKKILENINIKSFEPAVNDDWNDVRALNLSQLVTKS